MQMSEKVHIKYYLQPNGSLQEKSNMLQPSSQMRSLTISATILSIGRLINPG